MKKFTTPLITLVGALGISTLLLFSGIDVSDAATSILGFISVMLFASSIAHVPQNQ